MKKIEEMTSDELKDVIKEMEWGALLLSQHLDFTKLYVLPEYYEEAISKALEMSSAILNHKHSDYFSRDSIFGESGIGLL